MKNDCHFSKYSLEIVFSQPTISKCRRQFVLINVGFNKVYTDLCRPADIFYVLECKQGGGHSTRKY